jgi:Protein of unknown function (DUF3592)
MARHAPVHSDESDESDDRDEPGAQAARARIGKQVVLGIGLLALAVILWELRNVAPSWLAKRMTTSAEFTTVTERDDARIMRAFEAARQGFSAEARLEPEPNQTQVRHTLLTVVAPTSDEAVDTVTRMAAAMDKAFTREGEGVLHISVYRRARAVPDRTTEATGYALRIAVLIVGLLGVVVLTGGIQRLQAGPDRLPSAVVWGIVVIMGVPVAVLVLPAPIFMALFFMAIPGAITAQILGRTSELRHAANWPSTRARITKSAVRLEHRSDAQDVTEVKNLPDIEYEFTLGDRVIKGTRVSVADNTANVDEMLDHYKVGATVPVYYDPRDPEKALLERDPPLPVAWLYAIAGGIFLAGFAVLALFWNISTIFEGLAKYFPEKAVLPGVAFFTLAGVMILAMLWASRRQVAEAARWPQTMGRIVSSTVEHYRQRVGGARTGNLVTFYEAVVEYSYDVGGRNYHSTRLSFGAKAAGSQALAEEKAARYPAGSQVMVHYDPVNPANAVLDLKVAHGVTSLAVALVFFGLALFFSGVFR